MKEMLITTTNNLEGYRIVGYYGVVTSQILMDAKLTKQEQKWDEARRKVYEKLFEKLPAEANAIIGLQTAHNQFIGTGISAQHYFFATGTAVSVEKIE